MNNPLNQPTGKRILFANFPADGHFNPLTGLAVHLSSLGYDVRWYTSKSYGDKLKKIKIPHYHFKNAVDISDGEFEKKFPDRANHHSQISKLKYDLIHLFIKRGPEYYEDLKEIYKEFRFDLMIADSAFTGIPFVKDLMKIPVIAVGVFPLTETSKDLPPAGLGLTPSYNFFGRIKQHVLRGISSQVIFKEPNRVMHEMLDTYQISHNKEFVFDMLVQKSSLFLQSGTPGFEYYRSDLSRHIRFIGALLPYSSNRNTGQWHDDRLNRYTKIILVTQGTVEKDAEKILVPALEAFKNTGHLVVATTGGSQTQELRKRFPQENIIVEDFIPFDDVMPYADVYITNGGYGGVMLGIQNKLPMVVAGIHEGKNEICARVGYFKLGINLKNEKPKPNQIKKAVEKILEDDVYKQNINTLSFEFERYYPNELCAKYVSELLGYRPVTIIKEEKESEKVY